MVMDKRPYGRDKALEFIRELSVQDIYDLTVEHKKIAYSKKHKKFFLGVYQQNFRYTLFEQGLNWVDTHVPYWERTGEGLKESLLEYINGMHDLLTDIWLGLEED